LISGDSFRSLSHEVIDAYRGDELFEKRLGELSPLKYLADYDKYVLFIDLYIGQSGMQQSSFLDFCLRFKASFENRAVFIFHNHDVLPGALFFKSICDLGIKVFSVNVLDSDSGPMPIPIGLENRYFRKNGRLRPYLIMSKDEVKNESESKKRTNSVLALFYVDTNMVQRSDARDACLRHGIVCHEKRISPKHYRRLVKNSLFVLSPPGNGIDCHRTWEAIYLGAVPVVKKGYLAQSLTSALPILVVDDWQDICSLSRHELVSLYQDLRKTPQDMAGLAIWRSRIIQSRWS